MIRYCRLRRRRIPYAGAGDRKCQIYRLRTANRLLERGDFVVGIDVVNDYYDPVLKQAHLKVLDEVAARSGGAYLFIRADLAERRTLGVMLREPISSTGR